ncbi:MAG: GNAT family N-acetyltransferase [Salinivirgaceae bacterium]|jgi:GNAT superfamily N-acetyltransferase|nr:GNAT family N-acetyltransferase [Salinivirgaceae bacterium]
MVNPVKILKASDNHINGMVNLLEILLSQEADFVANKDSQVKGLKLILDNPDKGQLFVAIKNTEVIGMVNLLFTISTAIGEKVAILEDMVISPEYRNSGVGSLLIVHAVNFAKNEGFKRITLLTDDDNLKAHSFYNQHGFKKSAMIVFRKTI